MARGAVAPPEALWQAGEVPAVVPERPNVFRLYEQNIGLLTPMIAEELRDAERHFPAEWIADAFREAVAMNKRSWRYVAAILERWRVQGKDAGRAPTAEIPTDDAEARKRY